jgi:hypothetical protein
MLVISEKKFVTVLMERENLTRVFCGQKEMTICSGFAMFQFIFPYC